MTTSKISDIIQIQRNQDTKKIEIRNICFDNAYNKRGDNNMNNPAVRERGSMDIKKLSISSKRQITIPLKFFTSLGFEDEAECTVRGNELIIRPARNNGGGEFAEQILADLIAEGYEGNELLSQFKAMQKKVRPAVESMLEDALDVAQGNGEFQSYDDVFGTEE